MQNPHLPRSVTAQIEATYQKSPFVKEICVFEDLSAVVVPDMDLIRKRRIVNVGDLLRFEMEGRSIELPPEHRVRTYQIRFVTNSHPASFTAWPDDPRVESVLSVVRTRARGGETLSPGLNLELDLGLDSMDRVELLIELEQRFGSKFDDACAPDILTLGDLIDAVTRERFASDARLPENSWRVLLRDLPPPSDPVLSGLLARRSVVAPLLYLWLRILRVCVMRLHVTGVEQLPRNGPYLITPNHQSYLDPFFVCAALPYRIFKQLFFVGATEYFETPLTRRLARQINLVPVDPDANLIPAMKAGAFGLTRGKILMLFPEGERSIDGTVKKFKKGAPVLSQQLDVAIVPVAIRGVFEIWPRNRALNWKGLLPWRRQRVDVAFGGPIKVSPATSAADAARTLRERVVTMWNGTTPS